MTNTILPQCEWRPQYPALRRDIVGMLLTAPPSKRSRIPFDAVLVSDGQQIFEVRPPYLGLFLRAHAGKAFFLPNALAGTARDTAAAPRRSAVQGSCRRG